jgi:hypothetical protein
MLVSGGPLDMQPKEMREDELVNMSENAVTKRMKPHKEMMLAKEIHIKEIIFQMGVSLFYPCWPQTMLLIPMLTT